MPHASKHSEPGFHKPCNMTIRISTRWLYGLAFLSGTNNIEIFNGSGSENAKAQAKLFQCNFIQNFDLLGIL